MPSYEGKSYYQNKDVARQYGAQFTGSLTLANLRAKLYGLREEAVFLRLLNNVPEGGTVLDVPAGTGRYVDHLLSRGFVVGGVDVSPQMLEIARQRIGNNPNLLFLKVADAVELPFREREFSGVTCMRLYHRTPPEIRRKMLAEVRRVSQGWAILYFGWTNGWLALRRSIRSLFLRGRPSNPHPVTMSQLRSELHSVGMQLEEAGWVLPGLADGMLVRVSW